MPPALLSMTSIPRSGYFFRAAFLLVALRLVAFFLVALRLVAFFFVALRRVAICLITSFSNVYESCNRFRTTRLDAPIY